MAQKGSGRRQAPAYSADAMALRYMAGLVLIALGWAPSSSWQWN